MAVKNHNTPPSLEEEWAIKLLLDKAMKEHPYRDAEWHDFLQGNSTELKLIMDEGKLAANAVGYKPGQHWERIPKAEQLEITRILLDPRKFDAAVEQLNNSHLNKTTHFPELNAHLDLDALKDMAGNCGKYEGAHHGVLRMFQEAMKEDYVMNSRIDGHQPLDSLNIFPLAGDPGQLNRFIIKNIELNGKLSPEDYATFIDYAERKGLPTFHVKDVAHYERIITPDHKIEDYAPSWSI